MTLHKSKIKFISMNADRRIATNSRVSGKEAYEVRGQDWHYRGLYRTFGDKKFYYRGFHLKKSVAESEAEMLRLKGNYVRITKEKATSGFQYVLWVRS